MAIEITTVGGNLTEVNRALANGYQIVGFAKRDHYTYWALVNYQLMPKAV